MIFVRFSDREAYSTALVRVFPLKENRYFLRLITERRFIKVLIGSVIDELNRATSVNIVVKHR